MSSYFKRGSAIFVSFLCAATVVGQTTTSPNWKLTDNPKTQKLGPLGNKLDAKLVPLVKELRAGRMSAASALQQFRAQNKGTFMEGSTTDSLVLRLDCAVTDALLDQIRKTGARVTNSAPQWNTVMVECTVEQASALADIEGVRHITVESGAATGQSGGADNHADIDLKADQLRATYGLSGAGQKLGVLSDTCNRTAAVGAGSTSGVVPNAVLTNTNNQISGDLPSSYQVVDFGPLTGTDEGSGMMELAYDIIPGAGIAFASAFNGESSFATNIGLLRTAAGCTVICDDVFYFEEPFFQDGPIAQAIETAVGNGVPYFVLAGNHYDGGIQTTYTDINPGIDNTNFPATGEDFHNWGIGGGTPSFLPVTIGPSVTLSVTLQWNQPFASFGLGSGSEADMDLLLFSAASVGSTRLATSVNPQGNTGAPSGDPTELIQYTNPLTTSSQTVYLAVDHFQGTRGNVMRLVFLSNGVTYTFPSGGTGASTVYGHMATKDAITVGAIFYQSVPTSGTPGPAETFTSKGGIGANGIPIYFTTTGTLIAGGPELRDKPDITAPDGTNTKFFGSDIGADADTFPNFFGTSAATPNAAAVGVLLRQKKPSLTPATIKSILQSTARDVVGVSPPSAVGVDDRTGYGVINALAAGASSVTSDASDWALYD